MINDFLRLKMQHRFVCAFAGFLNENKTEVGCLIHPARWQGIDKRKQQASYLLSGIACGEADYLCPVAKQFNKLSEVEQTKYIREENTSDWYQFSQTNQIKNRKMNVKDF